jgi:hypothetical protein
MQQRRYFDGVKSITNPREIQEFYREKLPLLHYVKYISML